MYRFHSPCPSPLFHGSDEGIGHFEIFDEVDETETDVFRSLFAIADVVDDGDDAAHDFPVAPGDERLMVVDGQSGIPSFEQGFRFVRIERRDRVRVACIQFYFETDEFLQFPPSGNGDDGNHATDFL